MAAPAYEPTQEVRIGVVLYGGVSLAIYMNGVVQELLNLVWATAPGPDAHGVSGTPKARVADEHLRSTEAVYRRLGQLVTAAGTDPSGPAGPIRTRFVVDIIAGSSAGGINGVFLAKALANEKPMDRLKQLWVEEGDMATLLNDRGSRAGLKEQLGRQGPTESLLNGSRMYLLLLEALDDMDKAQRRGADGSLPAPTPRPPDSGSQLGGDESALVDELDLWVTATDLHGLVLPIRLADKTVFERRHRSVFHFVFGERQAETGLRNDFVYEHNPIAAFAARATSSFPFAFPPVMLRDIDAIVARTGRSSKAPASARPEWRQYFADYLHDTDGNERDFPYADQPFGDGGDIDNKPFGWVTDTLPKRRSTVPVDRKLLYVEPDPGRPELDGTVTGRPDVLASVVKAVSLGRTETIREDLRRLEQRNATVENLARAVDVVDEAYAQGVRSEAEETSRDAWLEEPPEVSLARGLGYASYLRLRLTMLADEYGRSLAGVTWFDEPTRRTEAMRVLVHEWVRARYRDPLVNPEDGDARPTGKEFLRDFDIEFRLRRLAFVARRADDLYCLDGDRSRRALRGAGQGIAMPGADDVADRDAWRRATVRAKKALNDAYCHLTAFVPALRTTPDSTTLARSLDQLKLTVGDLDGIMGGRDTSHRTAEDAARQAAAVLARPEVRGAFDDFADELAAFLHDIFKDAGIKASAGLRADPADPWDGIVAATLSSYYERYADYDQVLLPPMVAAGEVGEIDRVEVVRCSPYEATRLWDNRDLKLAGASVGHFGAFLDASWRRNDIMWGRLDGAERLISMLLPEGHPERDRLIDEAHDRILREEWQPDGLVVKGPVDETVAAGPVRADRLQEFRDTYRVPKQLERDAVLGLAARGTRVTGHILDTVRDRPGVSAAQTVVLWLGRILWGLAEVAVPRRLGAVVFRYWLSLAGLAGVAFVVIGAIVASPAFVSVGWTVIFTVLSIRAVVGVVSALVTGGKTRRKQALAGLGVVVVLALVALGVRDVAGFVRDKACDGPEWSQRLVPEGWCHD